MTRRPLILDGPEFTVRAENFANLVQVPEFRERLFTDPAAVAREEFGLDIDSATMSDTNRMTFALLTDPGFNGWAEEFQARVDALLPAGGVDDVEAVKALKDQFAHEFTDSIQKHLRPDTARLVSNPGQLVSEGDVAIVLLTFVVLIVVVTIAAGVMKPDELFNRRSLQMVIRRLEDQDLARAAQEAPRYER